eukprot:13494875-Ditylum_brightwellii.AAC.1
MLRGASRPSSRDRRKERDLRSGSRAWPWAGSASRAGERDSGSRRMAAILGNEGRRSLGKGTETRPRFVRSVQHW